jgi:hypothetical protein
VNAALKHLGAVSRVYEVKADEYVTVCTDLAEAKAEYTHAKAVFKIEKKIHFLKISDVELETRAHADEHIAGLYRQMLLCEAAEKSLEAKLRQLKEQQANGRTAVVQEREVDQIHANGLSVA